MGSKRYFFLSLFLLLVSSAGYAQPRIGVELFGGTSINTLNQGIITYWSNGWRVGGALAYHTMDNLDLTFNIATDVYPFSGSRPEFAIPEVIGFGYTGKPTITEEASVGLRAVTRSRTVSPYIAVNAGIFHQAIGTIRIRNYDSNGLLLSQFTYRGSGTSSTNLFASLGLGLMVRVDSRIRLFVEGGFTQSFAFDRTVLPITLRVQHDI